MYKIKLIIIFHIVFLSSFCTVSQNLRKTYTSLEDAIANPEQVEVLILNDIGLTSFPSQVYEFKNLSYLELSNNNIITIPDSIGLLSKLFYLDLSGNKINKIPDNFSKLTKLRSFYLDYGTATNLGQDFKILSDLPLLSVLGISSTNLRSLPATIGLLKNIKHFEL